VAGQTCVDAKALAHDGMTKCDAGSSIVWSVSLDPCESYGKAIQLNIRKRAIRSYPNALSSRDEGLVPLLIGLVPLLIGLVPQKAASSRDETSSRDCLQGTKTHIALHNENQTFSVNGEFLTLRSL
jgi:hypothetical protein